MDKPRVLILGKLPPPLIGPSLATQIILQSELKNCFDLIHFDTRLNNDVANMGKLKPAKIKVMAKKYSDFKDVLKSTKPELVLIPIAQTTIGFFKDTPFIEMAHRAGAKVVIQLRGSAFRTWYDRSIAIRRMVVSRELKKTSGAIVLADNLKYIFEGLMDDDKIFVVPNGADYTFPDKEKNEKVSLLYLANYLPGKGILEVLRALEILSEDTDLPPYEFRAYGSWDNEPYRRKCMNIATKLRNVRLGAPVWGAEKWKILAQADVFVFTPIHPEGHPWSIVEAAAAGLPVVSTNQGGISQNVINGKNGFLIEDFSPEVLAAHLKKLIVNPKLRQEMGSASLQLYQQKFTAKAMVQNLENVFYQIINRP